MAIRTFYWTPDDRLTLGLDDGDIQAALARQDGLLWVDIDGQEANDPAWLKRVFGFHDLAVEDCVSPLVHFPTVYDYGTYLFLIVHGVEFDASEHPGRRTALETTELALFIGVNYVVSHHNSPIGAVEGLVEKAGQRALTGPRQPDFLAHAIIDALVDAILPTVDRMAEVAESVEQAALQDPRRETLEEVRVIKRATLRLLRVMEPQREVLALLSRGAYPRVREAARVYYRDVYDHLVRIIDMSHTLRDVAEDAMEVYLTSVANRQNETIKVLTLIAIVALPLNLLTSFYGMNFEYLPGLTWRHSYQVVLGVMAAAAAGVAAWFIARYRPRVPRARPPERDARRPQ
jgi:magnesium transporter